MGGGSIDGREADPLGGDWTGDATTAAAKIGAKVREEVVETTDPSPAADIEHEMLDIFEGSRGDEFEHVRDLSLGVHAVVCR